MTTKPEPIEGPYYLHPSGASWVLCGPRGICGTYPTRERAEAARDRANARYALTLETVS